MVSQVFPLRGGVQVSSALSDLGKSAAALADLALVRVSDVGDDVLNALSDLGKSAAALADLALGRVSDVGDDVRTESPSFRRTCWAFAGAAWRATAMPTEAMDRAETFIVSMINRGLGLGLGRCREIMR